MKGILNNLQKIENAIVVISFAVMVACVFIQVVNRNFIKVALPWLDELATFSMIYMALLGTEAGLRDGSQIAVTAVVNKFHGKGRMLIHIISRAIVVGFSTVILFYSIHMVNVQAAAGQMTPALHLPMAVPYMALVISFVIIVCVQGAALIHMIIDLKNGRIEDDSDKEAEV